MNVTTQQLAELLAGIARSQQAIVDAIESESGGWRNGHLLNKLTVAANLRVADARLLDLPSRILLRQQTRVPMEPAQILIDLEKAIGPQAAAAVAGPAAAAQPAAAATAAPKKEDDLDFFNS